MIQAHLFISGSVQGVGYRQFVKSHAKKLGLTGWVRNLSDNRVEAVTQGKKENIEKLIELCRKGPFLAEVKDVIVKWSKENDLYNDFKILSA